LIDTLIAHGEALEAQDSDGRTALHLASEIEGENPTLQALLSSGSDVSAEDNLENTPLSVAAVNGGLESVKVLLSYGADLDELDEETLEQCVQEKLEIASYLRGLGLDVPVDVESGVED
jgi:ankyrin repeat protein